MWYVSTSLVPNGHFVGKYMIHTIENFTEVPTLGAIYWKNLLVGRVKCVEPKLSWHEAYSFREISCSDYTASYT